MLKNNEVIPGSYDPIFKSIMSTYKEYLADIVSYVTKIDKNDFLEHLVFKNVEYIMDNYKEPRKTSDLIVEIKDSLINIEMNNNYYKNIYKRNNRYLYKMINSNWNKEYFIQINIDNFNKSDEIISKFIMLNAKTFEKDDNIEKYRINLVKIEEKYYNEEKLTKEEKELLMLRINNKNLLKEISKGDKLMEKINDKINEMSEDPNLQLVYDRDEYVRYEAEEIAKDKYEEKNKSLDEKSKDLDEKSKDLDEKSKDLDEKSKDLDEKTKDLDEKLNKIIYNLKDNNMNLDEISRITNISIEKIKKILKED